MAVKKGYKMTRPMHDYTKPNRNNQARKERYVEPEAPVEIVEEVEETETEIKEVESEIETEIEVPVEEPQLDDPIEGTIYKCEVINLRSLPSLDGEILTRLHKGDVVQIEGEEDGWYAVVTSMGVEGYLVKDYVEV